jgi:phytoene dehydrogenase-like protein
MSFEAIVVGAGPNGLAAAIELARAGHSVLVVEAKDSIGGGARTEELTLPGFHHDVCSAIHPLGILSPFLASVPLEQRGVEWVNPPLALAHPFDDGTAAALEVGLEKTAARLAPDGAAWTSLFAPFQDARTLYAEILKPIRIPRHPLLMARFGFSAMQSTERIVSRFSGERAKAIFAGCAAHAMMPLEAAGTASFGLVLAAAAHAIGWPLPRRGSVAIIEALAAELRALGGTIRTGHHVRSLAEIPEAAEAKAIVFDVMPRSVADIAGDELPSTYADSLRRYRHGPGVFKIDWALSEPIPWKAKECSLAGTVHLGGEYGDIAASERAPHEGRAPAAPFVLVAQQSLFDDTRAPEGKHTGWAYCHVPNGSTVDMTAAIEKQLERFAPGFRDVVLARHTMNAAQVEVHNPGFIGGDIGGGENGLLQTLARPFPRWDPYATPNPRLYLASSATPPGGGVHGMCGRWAAKSALRRAFGRSAASASKVSDRRLQTRST